MYCWAASRYESGLLLRKAFLYGIGVVVAPQYGSISERILANMQALAMKSASIIQQEGISSSMNLATSWAAQTALWQLKLGGEDGGKSTDSSSQLDDEKQRQQRLALMPRLAESLALKCIKGTSESAMMGGSALEFSVRREFYFLYLRTLRCQNRWQEMLDTLQSDVFKANEETGVTLAPKQQILEQQAECFEYLENFQQARQKFEQLLEDYPDDVKYWKAHLRCSLAEHGNDEEHGFTTTENLVSRVIEERRGESYPKRGPYLMKLELLAERIKRKAAAASVAPLLGAEIKEYGNTFGPRVSCAFSDIETYLDMAVTGTASDDLILELLKWLQTLRISPDASDPKELRSQQRSYIFSVKMTHKILAHRTDLQQEWMPDWKELVRIWKKTLDCDPPIEVSGFLSCVICKTLDSLISFSSSSCPRILNSIERKLARR